MVRLAEPPVRLAGYRTQEMIPKTYKWLAKPAHKCESQDSTITMMDAGTYGKNPGRARVTDDTRAKFMRHYISDIQKHKVLYLSEKYPKTGGDLPRRFFLDLDMKVKADIRGVSDSDFATPFLRCIYDAVKQSLPPGSVAAARVIVLSSGLVLQPGQSPDEPQKIGYHLVWPGLILDQPRSFALRRLIVIELGHVFNDSRHREPARCLRYEFTESWSSIIDLNVIKGQSLRMPYSRKAEHGPGRDKSSGSGNRCFCGNPGPECSCYCNCRDLGRPYLPLCELDGVTGHIRCIEKLSPATVLPLATFTVPRGTPFTAVNFDASSFREEYETEFGSDTKSGNAARLESVEDDVSRLITSYCHARWRNFIAAATDITINRRRDEDTGQMCYLVSLHSNTCSNADSTHHTNSKSYLLIRRNGLVIQKCWSAKCKARMYHVCGPNLTVPPNITNTARRRFCTDRLPERMRKLLFVPKPKPKTKRKMYEPVGNRNSAKKPGAKKPRLNIDNDSV